MSHTNAILSLHVHNCMSQPFLQPVFVTENHKMDEDPHKKALKAAKIRAEMEIDAYRFYLHNNFKWELYNHLNKPT